MATGARTSTTIRRHLNCRVAHRLFTCRYHCLSGVSAALRDGSVAPNKDDMTFLEEVHEDEREMAANRVITAYTKGELPVLYRLVGIWICLAFFPCDEFESRGGEKNVVG